MESRREGKITQLMDAYALDKRTLRTSLSMDDESHGQSRSMPNELTTSTTAAATAVVGDVSCSADASASSNSESSSVKRTSAAMAGPPSDGYGLPCTIDDCVQVGQTSPAHAVVVARLPPPEMISSSFVTSSSDRGSSEESLHNLLVTTSSLKMPFEGLQRSPSDHSQTSSEERFFKRQKRTSGPCCKDVNHKRRAKYQPHGKLDVEDSSSGSGTEDGYAGEESSSDNMATWSQQLSTFDQADFKRKSKRSHPSDSDSSTVDDYEDSENGSSSAIFESCSSDAASADRFQATLPRNFSAPKLHMATRRKVQSRSILQSNYESTIYGTGVSTMGSKRPTLLRPNKSLINLDEQINNGRSPIFALSSDTMANVMSFLEPTEVSDFLTMPLCRDFRDIFTSPQELWRVLCLSEPFNAYICDEDADEKSIHRVNDLEATHIVGPYRMLFSSFVRCMRYLSRIKDDAINGRPLSDIGAYGGGEILPLSSNLNFKRFLGSARGAMMNSPYPNMEASDGSSSEHSSKGASSSGLVDHVGVTDQLSSVQSIMSTVAKTRRKRSKKRKKSETITPKFGYSSLTQRLLGPSKSGDAGNVNLPWSCAIYSILNWMVAFADVEGIQVMCLQILPFLLEDENQRTTAQRTGLTDVVLRGMVLFPDSVRLHIAAFHTIVLLARPLGGREGMLFHCSMVNSSGIFNDGSPTGKNGIAIMLDSMRRFESDQMLQAVSCWSLVNIALAPSQKAVLVKLGGITVVANAMEKHPFNAEVQFRALFALINLVIPSVNLADNDNAMATASLEAALGATESFSEREMLDETVGQISNLVVSAMKNFCASESILNRACLVVHNLSLTDDYHTALLWTPNCYQMLQWCMANYPSDRVLQQSAAGTLHRLQTTLSNDEDLRKRFAATLQSDNQSSLEQAHREARQLCQLQEVLSMAQEETTTTHSEL